MDDGRGMTIGGKPFMRGVKRRGLRSKIEAGGRGNERKNQDTLFYGNRRIVPLRWPRLPIRKRPWRVLQTETRDRTRGNLGWLPRKRGWELRETIAKGPICEKRIGWKVSERNQTKN